MLKYFRGLLHKSSLTNLQYVHGDVAQRRARKSMWTKVLGSIPAEGPFWIYLDFIKFFISFCT